MCQLGKIRTSLQKKFEEKIAQTQIKENKVQFEATKEVDQYLRESCISLDDSIYDWWRANATRFPRLAKVAKDVLAIVATETPCERCFSHAGNIVSDSRASL